MSDLDFYLLLTLMILILLLFCLILLILRKCLLLDFIKKPVNDNVLQMNPVHPDVAPTNDTNATKKCKKSDDMKPEQSKAFHI